MSSNYRRKNKRNNGPRADAEFIRRCFELILVKKEDQTYDLDYEVKKYSMTNKDIGNVILKLVFHIAHYCPNVCGDNKFLILSKVYETITTDKILMTYYGKSQTWGYTSPDSQFNETDRKIKILLGEFQPRYYDQES